MFLSVKTLKLSLGSMLLFAMLAIASGCATKIPVQGKNALVKPVIQSPVFNLSSTGYLLYDLDDKEVLAAYQSDKRFTPASNTKLPTALLSLETFGKEIPIIEYAEQEDTLLLFPTGYPGFGYLNDLATEKLNALIAEKKMPVKLILSKDITMVYGRGWAWDDSGYTFQVPLSELPLFGNRLQVKQTDSMSFFHKDQLLSTPDWQHPVNAYINWVSQIRPGSTPFYPDKNFIQNHFLTNPIIIEEMAMQSFPELNLQTLYVQADTFYQQMLEDSDNFIAEQLLMMACKKKTGQWSTNKFSQQCSDKWFGNAKAYWADGSGLSRYNAFTPKQMVTVLEKMIDLTDFEFVSEILPAGGKEGTLRNFYGSIPSENLFAKTGTLRHVHCLSGVLISKKGQRLLFSFMHNQIPGSNMKWKKEMERILYEIFQSR